MAKNKRAGGPRKACIGCGEMIHARKGKCDYCGTEQLSSKSASGRKSTKKSATKKRKLSKKTAATTGLDAVESAAEFISSVGGVQEAKHALAVAEGLAKKLT